MSEADAHHIQSVLAAIEQMSARKRIIIAITGAPASGKSTLAEGVVGALNARQMGSACLVPMDGFHLDNALLKERGLLDRKGAPETFDVCGLIACTKRLREASENIYVPVFDRQRDLAIANARHIPASCPIIVMEGNYLLLKQEPWLQLQKCFDLSIKLDVDTEHLDKRLVQRWLENGLSEQAAQARAMSNDIPNALLVTANSAPADMTLS
ncbi:MAG: nucleoside triphosphate hydrolase [Pseudomonadota bacterium]